MVCIHTNSLSPEWVGEKISCRNHSARERANNIMTMLEENAHGFLIPEEVAEVLIFKGLARNQEKFLNLYSANNTVQETTSIIFENNFNELTFEQIQDNQAGDEVLETALEIMQALTGLKYVGKAVAIAVLTLAYPHLFGTLDYIVPGLLHCLSDNQGTENPFISQIQDQAQFNGCLILPQHEGMTPYQARELAKDNYKDYIKELWNIKRIFGLNDFRVADIEMSIWSCGICYLKKQRNVGINPRIMCPLDSMTITIRPEGDHFLKIVLIHNMARFCQKG